jgi:hypothetical protein
VAVGPPGAPGTGTILLLISALVAVGAVVALALTSRPRQAWTLTLVSAGLTVALLLAQGPSIAP